MSTEELKRPSQSVPSVWQWIFETIHPYIKERVMEIDSGSTSIVGFLFENGIKVHLSDSNLENCELLAQKYSGISGVRSVHHINFHNPNFDQLYITALGRFGTVILLNIFGNSRIDPIAITNVQKLLRLRGHLIILMPTYTALFNGFQENLEDWKRSNRKNIQKQLGNDIEILKTEYLNLCEYSEIPAGWYGGISVLAIGRKT
jgi:hypothetical protein